MRKRTDIISFRDALPADGRGWSQRELCEIDRVRAASGKRPQLELVTGESDEGDPWCVVCHEGERVLLHIARIDRGYLIARPYRSGLKRTESITAATDLALRWLDRELALGGRAG
jgi:hypothetical protein